MKQNSKQQSISFVEIVAQSAPVAQLDVQAFPSTPVTTETQFVIVNGVVFINNDHHEEVTARMQLEMELLDREIAAMKLALGVDKSTLLLALHEAQAGVQMMQDYVLTLGSALLVAGRNEKTTTLDSGSRLVTLTADEAEAIEAAIACILPEDSQPAD